MSYDSITDVIVDSLRAIALQEVNAAPSLANVLGAESPAIRKTFNFPIPLSLVAEMETPALAVYVRRETGAAGFGRHKDRILNVFFEYVGPLTGHDKLSTTWPLLRAVWVELLKAIAIGKVGGVDVVGPVGVLWTGDETALVDFDFVANGEHSFPGFVGQVQITWRPNFVDTSALPALIALHANLDLYEGTTKTKDDHVSFIASNT